MLMEQTNIDTNTKFPFLNFQPVSIYSNFTLNLTCVIAAESNAINKLVLSYSLHTFKNTNTTTRYYVLYVPHFPSQSHCFY